MATRPTKLPMNFESMRRTDVPNGRNGRHRLIVTQVLSDLDQIPAGVALKIPLARLDDGKAKIRSALNRAARKAGRIVATSSDDEHLYVWNEKK